MPLSEVHRTAMRKGKPSTFPTDVISHPFMPDNEFVELLWEENGQSKSMMKRGSFPIRGIDEKDGRNNPPKGGGAGKYSSSKDDVAPPAVPRANVGMNANDDMVPWMNYPLEESPLQNDYCSEFFSEFPGFNLNPAPSFNQGRDSQNMDHGNAAAVKPSPAGIDPTKPKLGHFFQLSQSVPSSSRSRISEIGVDTNNADDNAPLCFSGDRVGLGLEKPDTVPVSKSNHHANKVLTNFSHFSRHDALAKANPQAADRLRSCEKASAPPAPVELTLVGPPNGLNHVGTPLPKVGLGPPHLKPAPEMVSEAPVEVLRLPPIPHGDMAVTNATSKRLAQEHVSQQSASFSASASIGMLDNDKISEPVVVSSICSINSARTVSGDRKQKGKRKAREGEESGYQSDDLANDSVGVKKPATWNKTYTKRSRAAEVHNLSERRRRDRINERMRALQELIPNCNKVDKASMLDEAIEYLKTLQLQVQIMSMGNGMCMPPMMLSPGLQMQHMQAPQMGLFSPMAMGMGMGYGMGMLDMNSPPGFPLTHVPRMPGSQFPCTSISNCYGMHGLPGSTIHPMFGNSGHGIPLSVPPTPMHAGSFLGTSQSSVPDTLVTSTTSIPALDAGAAVSSNEQRHSVPSLDASQKSNSNLQLPSLVQEANELFEQPVIRNPSDQPS